jgi:hypothetical protein
VVRWLGDHRGAGGNLRHISVQAKKLKPNRRGLANRRTMGKKPELEGRAGRPATGARRRVRLARVRINIPYPGYW